MKKITLYHTTDIHGQIMPKSSNTRMGMVKVSSFLKSVRSENSNILILNSGDCVSGDPICDLTNGLSLIDAMNICGYSASCIGNHDFDFGKENISHLIERAKFKFVCANLLENEKSITKEQYCIYEIASVKILIIGIISKQAFDTIKESKRMGIQFVDPWKAIESLQVKLVNEKILFDLILVLNHGNAPDDISLLCDEKKGSRVDLILSGHDHYVSYCRYDNMYPARASKCSVHSGSNTEVIQKIDLEIDETKMRINNIKTCTFDLKRMIELNIANDSDVEDIEKMIRKNHQELDDEVVFCESVISKQKIRTLVERALAWHTNLEISYLTNGGIRSIFPQGVVTYEDVLTICPFDDLVCMVNIYGNEVNPDVVERLKVEHNINIECNERVYRIATNDYAIEQRVLFKNDKIAAIIRDEGRIECLDRVQVKFVFIEYLKKLRRISDIIDFVSFKTSFED